MVGMLRTEPLPPLPKWPPYACFRAIGVRQLRPPRPWNCLAPVLGGPSRLHRQRELLAGPLLLSPSLCHYQCGPCGVGGQRTPPHVSCAHAGQRGPLPAPASTLFLLMYIFTTVSIFIDYFIKVFLDPAHLFYITSPYRVCLRDRGLCWRPTLHQHFPQAARRPLLTPGGLGRGWGGGALDEAAAAGSDSGVLCIVWAEEVSLGKAQVWFVSQMSVSLHPHGLQNTVLSLPLALGQAGCRPPVCCLGWEIGGLPS